jgi:cardiolipin synthase (CMP-forming)
MTDPGRKSTANEAPEYAASAFTQELLDEMARDHYRLHAWKRFLSRSWARSLDDIRASPARTRSFWLWTVAVGVTGFAVVMLAWWFQASGMAIRALALWLPWYAAAVFFVLTHLGMANNIQGAAHDRLLLPNGLSFMRLALAPLVLLPGLGMPVHPVTGPVFAVFLVGLSASDVLDGWLARRQQICTRLGSMLDSLADLALLTFLAVGLYRTGAIPPSLLLLLLVRYPLLLIGVLVLYFAKGPAPLAPTFIGKVTTFVTSVVLLSVAVTLLVPITWPPSSWVELSVWYLHLLIAANILYLLYRGAVWRDSSDT